MGMAGGIGVDKVRSGWGWCRGGGCGSRIGSVGYRCVVVLVNSDCHAD